MAHIALAGLNMVLCSFSSIGFAGLPMYTDIPAFQARVFNRFNATRARPQTRSPCGPLCASAMAVPRSSIPEPIISTFIGVGSFTIIYTNTEVEVNQALCTRC